MQTTKAWTRSEQTSEICFHQLLILQKWEGWTRIERWQLPGAFHLWNTETDGTQFNELSTQGGEQEKLKQNKKTSKEQKNQTQQGHHNDRLCSKIKQKRIVESCPHAKRDFIQSVLNMANYRVTEEQKGRPKHQLKVVWVKWSVAGFGRENVQ